MLSGFAWELVSCVARKLSDVARVSFSGFAKIKILSGMLENRYPVLPREMLFGFASRMVLVLLGNCYLVLPKEMLS